MMNNIERSAFISDQVTNKGLAPYIVNQTHSVPRGTIVLYRKKGSLLTYAGKVLSFTHGSAFPLKIERHNEQGKFITSHRLEDFVAFQTGGLLHDAIRTARGLNAEYTH